MSPVRRCTHVRTILCVISQLCLAGILDIKEVGNSKDDFHIDELVLVGVLAKMLCIYTFT